MPDALARAARARQVGPKHDLWVVPYADMMTLMFALFVVLYAIGEIRLQKLEQLRRSMAIAFNGSTGGYDEAGQYDLGPIATGGELVDGCELVNAQPGPMREFLLETLPREYEEIAGHSLEIVLTDDTVAFVTSLDRFFAKGSELPREDVQLWLVRMFEGVSGFASGVRIRIEAPDVPIGTDESGRTVRADALCSARLVRLRAILRMIPQVENRLITTELRALPPVLSDESWEARGRITIAFSNQ